VLGPYGSASTNAVADVTEKHRTLMIAPAAGTTSIWEKGRKYLIMVLSPLEGATEGTIDLAARNGLKTIAVINVDTLPAKAVAKGALDLAKKKGLQVVLHETYPPGTTDFSAILNKAKEAKPDLLVVNYIPAEVIAMTRQMKELDVNVKMLSATPGGGFLDYQKALANLAEFVYAGSYWDPSLPYPGNREFVAAYHRKRDRIYEGIKDNYELTKPEGAFYLFPKAPRGTGTEFVAEAIRNQLLCIPGAVFSRQDTHFRLSYAADDYTLDRGIEILNRLARE